MHRQIHHRGALTIEHGRAPYGNAWKRDHLAIFLQCAPRQNPWRHRVTSARHSSTILWLLIRNSAHRLEIRNMITEFGRWLTPLVLCLVAKEYIERPQFSIPKCRELRGVRPEHECNDATGQGTSGLQRWLQELVVGIQKHFRSV